MDLGLTQQTLAEKIGCWYQSVAGWERDDRVPLAARWPMVEAILDSGLALYSKLPGAPCLTYVGREGAATSRCSRSSSRR